MVFCQFHQHIFVAALDDHVWRLVVWRRDFYRSNLDGANFYRSYNDRSDFYRSHFYYCMPSNPKWWWGWHWRYYWIYQACSQDDDCFGRKFYTILSSIVWIISHMFNWHGTIFILFYQTVAGGNACPGSTYCDTDSVAFCNCAVDTINGNPEGGCCINDAQCASGLDCDTINNVNPNVGFNFRCVAP